ncbi:DUF5062 family protein [Thalassotalea maritima]|uniref:DUF5062 family protein n=1 Tax=Thalassotalea maritima TaxID=3242416 RepID=UPI0035274197
MAIKKIKNESELVKIALRVGESYAVKRGFNTFAATDNAKQKIEALYRLLVHDKLVVAVPEDQESQPMMRHKLAIWISKQLPKDHPLAS